MSPPIPVQKSGLSGPMIGANHPMANAAKRMPVPTTENPGIPNVPQRKRKRPTDKNLSKKIEAFVPESKLYTQLQEFEKRLDTTITRKTLDIQDILSKPPKRAERTLRIFLTNTCMHQPTQEQDKEPLNPEFTEGFDLKEAQIPSWTFRIEGRLLDTANVRRQAVNAPKFTSFFRSIVVKLDRDPTLFPEGNVIEWTKSTGGQEADGFEIKRKGDVNVPVKILLYLDHVPDRFKLPESLAMLLDIHTDTMANIIMALWQYVKIHRLQDAEDRRYINCDANLEKLFGVKKILFPQLPELLHGVLLPPDPIELDYVIRVDKEYTVNPYAFDVQVEIEDAIRDKLKAVAFGSKKIAKPVAEADEHIATLVQAIHGSKLKRDFMLAFAENPVEFINEWVASQSRDAEVILGDVKLNPHHVSGDLFASPSMQEALFHYLRQSDVIQP